MARACGRLFDGSASARPPRGRDEHQAGRRSTRSGRTTPHAHVRSTTLPPPQGPGGAFHHTPHSMSVSAIQSNSERRLWAAWRRRGGTCGWGGSRLEPASATTMLGCSGLLVLVPVLSITTERATDPIRNRQPHTHTTNRREPVCPAPSDVCESRRLGCGSSHGGNSQSQGGRRDEQGGGQQGGHQHLYEPGPAEDSRRFQGEREMWPSDLRSVAAWGVRGSIELGCGCTVLLR